MESLYLIHPWLDTLLERGDKSNVIMEEDFMPPRSPNTEEEEIDDDSSPFAEPEPPPQPAHVRMIPKDRESRARGLVAHLRQPFGALLVTLASAGGRADYRRVAADSLITVQFQENVSLVDILDNVRTLDVL
ncbi:hypothetical protein OG21DRAFT_1488970 [Imleria badia]|nr:hypothetical protein OG21DRAFT_1488970 [Imleria badia]